MVGTNSIVRVRWARLKLNLLQNFLSYIFYFVSLIVAIAASFLVIFLAGCVIRRPVVHPGPVYVRGFWKPRPSCIEIKSDPGTALKTYACPPQNH